MKMRVKVMFVLVLMAIFRMLLFAHGAVWTTYQRIDYPGMSTDWTLLLGSPTVQGGTNRQWALTNFFYMMRTNAQYGMQPQSDNLDAWSDIVPSTKQDHSTALDLWAGHVPSEYQPLIGYIPATTNFATLIIPGLILPDGITLTIDPTTHKLSSVSGGSGTLTGPGSITAGHIATWSTTTSLADSTHSLSEYALSTITNGWPWQALNQPLTANGTAWSLLAPSAKQDALGFTPLTPLQSFQQASNLVITLTLPLDSLAPATGVAIFGVDSTTNPVPIHLRNNLSFTSDGVGGYYIDASASGGTSVLGRTNLYARTTNAVLWDLAINQTFNIGMLGTNSNLILTNAYALSNYENGQLGIHQWTNGGFTVATILVKNGLLRTNGLASVTTNANATDLILARLDPTGTNVVLSWLTNCSSYTDTNSLLSGGGGGGGSFSIVNSAVSDSYDNTSYGAKSAGNALNATGANLLVAYVGYGGGTAPTFTDNLGNTWTGTTGNQAAGNPHCLWYYCISPTVSSSMVFTNSAVSSQACGFHVYAIAKSGSAPIFDSEQIASTGNWIPVRPFTATASVTPGGANNIMLSGLIFDTVAGTGTLDVDSGFTKKTEVILSGSNPANSFATATLIQTAATAQNPGWQYSSANPFADCATDLISFH